MQRRHALARISLATAGLVAGPAFAQVANPHIVRLVVPYPPGGLIDQQARLLATPMQRELRQDVIVDNVPGAAGAIGLQRLLAAPADGHELAFATDSDAVLLPMISSDVRYRPGQFRVLSLVAHGPMVLLASQGWTAELRDTIAEGRSGALRARTFASYGIGSNSHLCAEDFATRAGISLVHVPYKGVAPLMGDLLGNHVDLAFLPLAGPVLEVIKAGKLRALGVAAPERDPRLPQVPTIDQASGLKGFSHASWSAVVASDAMPEAKARELHKALHAAVANTEFQRELTRTGGLPMPVLDYEQDQAFLVAEVARYRRLADAWLARGPSATR